jgi:hypothetical protein
VAQHGRGRARRPGDGDPETFAFQHGADTVVIVDDQSELAIGASLTLVGGRPAPAARTALLDYRPEAGTFLCVQLEAGKSSPLSTEVDNSVVST